MALKRELGCEGCECQAKEVEHNLGVGGEPSKLCELGQGRSRAAP